MKNRLYDPIEDEIPILFKSIESIKKDHSNDLIIFSCHGEVYDIYRYKITDAIIDSLYPKYSNSWDGEIFTVKTEKTSWRRTPLEGNDTLKVNQIITPVLNMHSTLHREVLLAINSVSNYYSYIIVDDFHQYLLVYCPDSSFLYYVRKKNIS